MGIFYMSLGTVLASTSIRESPKEHPRREQHVAVHLGFASGKGPGLSSPTRSDRASSPPFIPDPMSADRSAHDKRVKHEPTTQILLFAFLSVTASLGSMYQGERF